MDYNAINIYPADEFSWGIDISVTPAEHCPCYAYVNEYISKHLFAIGDVTVYTV